MANEYGASQIKVLEGLEAVRKRPAMYIGSTHKDGLHHLVWEIIDNSVDEHLAGYGKEIQVVINKDGSFTVKDHGRGIPVEINEIYKIPAVELALTKLHAGGKFDKDSYKVSGGLHGVGMSCVNALSVKLIVEIQRNGKIHQQEYSRGNPTTKLKVIGECNPEENGTTITFWPDPEIFSTIIFDHKVLENRFREITFLNAGLKVTLSDERDGFKAEFFAEGGLMEFVKWLNRTKEVLHKPIYFKKEADDTVVEVALQYNEGYQENIFGFVNTINTVEGGTHVSGFKTAVTRVINDYVKKKGLLKSDTLTGDDVREGLTSVISIKIGEPQFEGQTKTKLGNSEVKGLVDSAVSLFLTEFLEENPNVAKRITGKALDSAKARLAAKRAKDLVRRKNAFSLGGLPGKLSDCANKKAEDTEVYLVEGDSAGGCFSGETKVALADGRNLSFKDLVKEDNEGKENFCYTIKEDGRIGIKKIENPRVTKKDAKVIKIILDNDEEIVCTPDHKFMLRDGNFKEAKDLTDKDSLMPLRKKISQIGGRITIEGYEMIWENEENLWKFTHILADEYNLDKNYYEKNQGGYRHHIDFNKLNNNPTNLVRMKREDHFMLHAEHLTKTLHREDVKEKCRQIKKTQEYRKKMSDWANSKEVKEMLSKRAKKQWQNLEYKEFMIDKFLEFYNSNEDYRQENELRLNKAQKEYWAKEENKKKASLKTKNFFKTNLDAKKNLSNKAKEQWDNEELIIWRRQKTKEQWTPEFKQQRKEAYNNTYYNTSIKFMKEILEKTGKLDSYDSARIDNRNKNMLSMNTFCKRFFEDNYTGMLEAVRNYNHKIRSIEVLNEKIDVYDIEVAKTHNFALASGVFVHNSARQARNKDMQAILPLKGKILNVEKANTAKALSSEEITNMITAIGVGVGEQFDISKLRYKRIIIMTDADVDGEHIKTLLLTFFFRFMPQLIENGNIFVAMPPLYRVRKKKDYYVYTEKELKKICERLDATNVTRFKGLGEMSASQLWETTMDPKTRKLKRVFIEDAIVADQTFSMLMGDDVQGRKAFIAENAENANLDI